MPRKRIETGSKICQTCGSEFSRHSSEAIVLFDKRIFCSKSCVRRKLKPDADVLGRYRQTKVGGRKTQVHRLVMEKHVGRKLMFGEIVHHKDRNKLNNTLSNLELVTPKRHAEIHLLKHAETWLCATCGKLFTPHKTKRGRKKNCSPECFREYQKRSHGHYTPQQSYPFFKAIAQVILGEVTSPVVHGYTQE